MVLVSTGRGSPGIHVGGSCADANTRRRALVHQLRLATHPFAPQLPLLHPANSLGSAESFLRLMSDQRTEEADSGQAGAGRSKLASRLQAFQQPSTSLAAAPARPPNVSGGGTSFKDRIAKFQAKADNSAPPAPSNALGLGGSGKNSVGASSTAGSRGMIGNRIPTGDKSAAYVGVGGHVGRHVSESKGLIGTRIPSIGRGLPTSASSIPSGSPSASDSQNDAAPSQESSSITSEKAQETAGLDSTQGGKPAPQYIPADVKEQDLVPSSLPRDTPLDLPSTPLSTAAEPSEKSPSLAPSTPIERDIPLIRIPSNLSSVAPSATHSTDTSEPISAATSVTGVPSSMMVETEGEGPAGALEDVDGVSTPSSTPKVVRRELPLVEEGVPPLSATERDALEQEAIGDAEGASSEGGDDHEPQHGLSLKDRMASLDSEQPTATVGLGLPGDASADKYPLGNSANTPIADRAAFLDTEDEQEGLKDGSLVPDIEDSDEVTVIQARKKLATSADVDDAALADGTAHLDIGTPSTLTASDLAVTAGPHVEDVTIPVAEERPFEAPSPVDELAPQASRQAGSPSDPDLTAMSSASSYIPASGPSETEGHGAGEEGTGDLDVHAVQETLTEPGLSASTLAGKQVEVEPSPYIAPREEGVSPVKMQSFGIIAPPMQAPTKHHGFVPEALPSVPLQDLPLVSAGPSTPTGTQTPISASFLDAFPSVPASDIGNPNEKVNVQIAFSPDRAVSVKVQTEEVTRGPRTSSDSSRSNLSSSTNSSKQRPSSYGPRDPLDDVDDEGEGGWAAVSSERVRYA